MNFGIWFPCELVEVRDGDTVVVQIREHGFEWAIRLIDTWCPELRSQNPDEREQAWAAKAYAEELLDEADELSVFVPWDVLARENLLKIATFDRIPGYVFVSPSQSLNELMVEGGFATKEKS